MPATQENEKRVLIYATTAYMIDQFNMMNIRMLQDMGYTVDAACNFEFGNPVSPERLEAFQRELDAMGVRRWQLPLTRNIFDIVHNGSALRRSVRIMKERKYAFVHCHTPVGSVMARIAGRLTGTRVIYTAHGFHFFDGAPLLNWLVYYPVEMLFSGMTEVLITINREDFERAKRKFRMKRLEYVPGIGIDFGKFCRTVSAAGCVVTPGDNGAAGGGTEQCSTKNRPQHDFKSEQADEKPEVGVEQCGNDDRAQIRKEFGIDEDAFVLLSVGELSVRKNHIAVLKVLAKMRKEAGTMVSSDSDDKLGQTGFDTEDSGNSGQTGCSAEGKALPELLSNTDKLKYVIVGTGRLKEELQRFIEDNGLADTVILAGYRTDTARIYRATDAFVFPSLQEGLPAALMEAMASGLPVAVSRIRGNTDLIEETDGLRHDIKDDNSHRSKVSQAKEEGRPSPDGPTENTVRQQTPGGLLFDVHDESSIRSAIEGVLALDPKTRRAMGERNAAVIRDGFSKEAVRAKLDEIYRSME